jgi:heat shock protein HtpX
VSDQNLFAQQTANKRKSAWLIGGFLVFFAWIGFGGDYGLYLATRGLPPGNYHHLVPLIGLATTLVATGMAWTAWTRGDQKVLGASGAWELITPATPEQQQLSNVVEEMAIAAGIPRPRVWVIPDKDPNAFATGKDPQHASVAVTEGLLTLLNREELQAVVAHEMSHIRNYDIRLMTLLAAMVGAVGLISHFMLRSLRGVRLKKTGAPVALVVLLVWVLTLILAPIASAILSMAVSRKREYLADATGAQLNRNPLALATALEKVDAAPDATRSIIRGAGHLCIVDPGERKLASRAGFLSGLFESHPPIRLRVARLHGMGYAGAKRAAPTEQGA